MIKPRPKHILTDSDGCLVNWLDGFNTFMEDKGFPRIPNSDHHYHISDRHHGVEESEAKYLIKEFNESSHIARLGPYADAQEYVQKLANLGFRFTVITSLSNKPEAKEHRTSNLLDLFGYVFEDIVCLEQGVNKYDELTRWSHSGLFWIEDHYSQAMAGYRAGLHPILINHPYNVKEDHSLFPTVEHTSPWKEIYRLICKDYGLHD